MHLKVEGGWAVKDTGWQRCLTGSVLPGPVPWAQEKLSRVRGKPRVPDTCLPPLQAQRGWGSARLLPGLRLFADSTFPGLLGILVLSGLVFPSETFVVVNMVWMKYTVYQGLQIHSKIGKRRSYLPKEEDFSLSVLRNAEGSLIGLSSLRHIPKRYVKEHYVSVVLMLMLIPMQEWGGVNIYKRITVYQAVLWPCHICLHHIYWFH